MAWSFSLSAECGADESKVNEFARSFQGIEWTLSKSRLCQCRTDTFQDMEENWWCRVYPNNISEVGINSPECAYLMTELGILLYQRLRSAPAFRYALVGVEVDEFRTYSELMSELMEDLDLAEFSPLTDRIFYDKCYNLSIAGLVLAKEMYEQINPDRPFDSLLGFRPFRDRYVWQPYKGEVYNPLMTSPDLQNQLNELITVG